MKVKDGQIYSWVGSIREKIFSTREGEDATTREKKRKVIRRNTKTFGEKKRLDSPVQRRISRSTNDLSRLIASKQGSASAPESFAEKQNSSTHIMRKNDSVDSTDRKMQREVARMRTLSNSMASVLSGDYHLTFFLRKNFR